ncbi:MAG: hypothetical protein PHU85_15130, partial [Phycisphaerae bacterium]|nr:hypothetical protein [Phycisphaerae bacterium]
ATGTTATAFEADTDGTKPSIAISADASGTGDFTATLMPAATLTADRTIRFPDADDTAVLLAATQTLTNKTLTAPTIANPTVTDGTFTGPTMTNPIISGAHVAMSGNLDITNLSATGTWTDLGTVTTVDLNGGTVDGAVIGGASAAAGTFTTLASTGAATLASLVCTAGATFGGGYGGTGCTISTAGVIQANGALTVDGAITGAAPENTLASDDTTDGVVDILVLGHSSSDNNATAADGVGVSFKLENATGTSTYEEWASIDVLSTTITNGSEDGDIVVKAMLAGTVTEALRLDSSDQSLTLGRNATDANGIYQLRIYPVTGSKGSLLLQAAANTGDTVLTVTNVAQGGANTVQIPDIGAGATDQFVMEDVAQTLTNKTVSGASNTVIALPFTSTVGAASGDVTNAGIPFVLEFTITDADPDDAYTVDNGTYNLRVLDAWMIKDGVSADGGDTIQIKNNGTAITDAKAVNVSDKAKVNFTSFDYAQLTVADGDTLDIDGTNSTDCSAQVFVLCMWV